jgi:hypothetical protein
MDPEWLILIGDWLRLITDGRGLSSYGLGMWPYIGLKPSLNS